jgi:hypothetical protein
MCASERNWDDKRYDQEKISLPNGHRGFTSQEILAERDYRNNRRRLKLIGAVDTWWEILNKKRRIFASLRLLRLCV